MKCIHCEAEWKTKDSETVTVTKCPFCGENPLLKKEEAKSFDNSKAALAAICKQFGADVLLGKLKGYLPDFAPSLKDNDKNLVYTVQTSGASKALKDNLNGSQDDKERAVKIAIRNLTDAYISQEVAENIIYEFTDALGWKVVKPKASPKSEPKPAPEPATKKSEPASAAKKSETKKSEPASTSKKTTSSSSGGSVSKPSAPQEPSKPEKPNFPHGFGVGKRVLVVDDSAFIGKQLSQMLTSEAFEVIAFVMDGAQAVKKYQELQSKIDFVTMDIVMPVMDGVEALEKILSINRNAKVIMVSSQENIDKVKKCLLMGAVSYFMKPLDQTRVLNRIYAVIKK
ncbi:MAG: response regulator [Treponema sp.]|nr:response regulator [Treponema sp.]MCL2252204.1 response regulator [Treponema sp.]